jgi:hypothetical protein
MIQAWQPAIGRSRKRHGTSPGRARDRDRKATPSKFHFDPGSARMRKFEKYPVAILLPDLNQLGNNRSRAICCHSLDRWKLFSRTQDRNVMNKLSTRASETGMIRCFIQDSSDC